MTNYMWLITSDKIENVVPMIVGASEEDVYGMLCELYGDDAKTCRIELHLCHMQVGVMNED